MSFTPRPPSRQRVLTAAFVALLFAGAAQATDLYDSLKIWNSQAAEAQKLRAQRDMSDTSAAPGMPGLTNPSGPMGPIRNDMSEDQQPAAQEPAWQQQTPQSDDSAREQPATDERTKSP